MEMRRQITFSVIVYLTCLVFGCQFIDSQSFLEWHKNQHVAVDEGIQVQPKYFELRSEPMLIDQIYRSMEGPHDIKSFTIKEPGEEFVWLVGYEAKMINSNTDEVVSDGFMCHNNLNVSKRADFPWRINTAGKRPRIFTLTEGQTKLRLPSGYAIPVPVDCPIELVSQVLNHNYSDLKMDITHDIKITYVNGSEADFIPLYQQAIFVTKQLSGPPGDNGLPLSCFDPDKHAKHGTESTLDCSIKYEDEEFNPYSDKYGRKYTGHWKIPVEKEVLKTNVTQMLGLKHDTKVHYIGVHLHPFATSLELWDMTDDTLLFKSLVEGHEDAIGIKNMEHYSSEEGITLHHNHQYELVSTYNCTDSVNEHTAMATMFLYMEDQ